MNEQELQQKIVQLVQAAMAGDQQAAQQINEIEQAADQGDEQAKQIVTLIQQVAQQVQSAKFGAKLNYIKSLRGMCPEGTEMKYYKVGGKVCKKCMAKQALQQGGDLDPIEAYKCGRKVKKGQWGTNTGDFPGLAKKKKQWAEDKADNAVTVPFMNRKQKQEREAQENNARINKMINTPGYEESLDPGAKIGRAHV